MHFYVAQSHNKSTYFKSLMNKLLYFFLILICIGCTSNTETERYWSKCAPTQNIKEKIKEIKIEDVLIGGTSRLYLMKDYLMIVDHASYDKQIHIFDKNSFKYITSIAPKGEGPNEITVIGNIGVNEQKGEFYVSDHGKLKIYSYNLDSVLTDSLYKPQVKTRMNADQFPDRYQYINDTLCIGLIIVPIGVNDYTPHVAKWNINTGDIRLMKYEHPDITKKRISYAVSIPCGLYAEAYRGNDLLTICNLDGHLKYNIYGPKWEKESNSQTLYYRTVKFCKDKILASYSGESGYTRKYGKLQGNSPTKINVYDLNGHYIKTMETEYPIIDFIYDESKNRLIMSLDAEIQFATLDLDGLLD